MLSSTKDRVADDLHLVAPFEGLADTSPAFMPSSSPRMNSRLNFLSRGSPTMPLRQPILTNSASNSAPNIRCFASPIPQIVSSSPAVPGLCRQSSSSVRSQKIVYGGTPSSFDFAARHSRNASRGRPEPHRAQPAKQKPQPAPPAPSWLFSPGRLPRPRSRCALDRASPPAPSR